MPQVTSGSRTSTHLNAELSSVLPTAGEHREADALSKMRPQSNARGTSVAYAWVLLLGPSWGIVSDCLGTRKP